MRLEYQARMGDARILSGADFAEKPWVQGALSLERRIEVGQLGWNLPTLCAAICHDYQVNEKSLLTRGRLNNVSCASQLAAFFCYHIVQCQIRRWREFAQRQPICRLQAGAKWQSVKPVKSANAIIFG
jgi:hypothetical protein